MYDKVNNVVEQFHTMLLTSNAAKQYLYKRHISDDDIKMFKLGFALRGRFENRIIFPTYDAQHRPVGWTGRSIIDIDPKYLNTNESLLYQKSRILYGYSHALSEIKKTKQAILVEGPIDCIRLQKSGFRNCVATCGALLKTSSARLLSRYIDLCYILYDPDEVGQSAAIEAKTLLDEIGVKTKIITLPEPIDPDLFVLKYGADELNKILKE